MKKKVEYEWYEVALNMDLLAVAELEIDFDYDHAETLVIMQEEALKELERRGKL